MSTATAEYLVHGGTMALTWGTVVGRCSGSIVLSKRQSWPQRSSLAEPLAWRTQFPNDLTVW